MVKNFEEFSTYFLQFDLLTTTLIQNHLDNQLHNQVQTRRKSGKMHGMMEIKRKIRSKELLITMMHSGGK